MKNKKAVKRLKNFTYTKYYFRKYMPKLYAAIQDAVVMAVLPDYMAAQDQLLLNGEQA